MNIAVRLEGGLGDHLLGHRFVHAIKEKYPNCKIHAFSDTEGNSRSIELLRELFPSIYKEAHTVGKRKNQNFEIKTPFGNERYPAHIRNLPDSTLTQINACDKFYDLHIDGLNWLNYDFDWLRYYYFFPKPEIDLISPYESGYIMAHLYSRPDSPYNLEQWYTIQLLSKLSENNKIVIITQQEHKEYYSQLFNNSNITINTANNVLEIFKIAQGCSCFIGIDSGIRYIPYYFSKPVFVFSKYCTEYGSVAYSHLIRWLIFPKMVLPMHFNIDIVKNMIYNSIHNPVNILFPELLENSNIHTANRFGFNHSIN
jgi:ADP-heptose:LPS heptosyltransferase